MSNHLYGSVMILYYVNKDSKYSADLFSLIVATIAQKLSLLITIDFHRV